MLFGDMGYMPWFGMPQDYHFGGHTFTVCGWDGADTILIADMDQKAVGPKKGFYHPVSLEELAKLRGSPHKPFPPKNGYLEFDFSGYRDPTPDDLVRAIRQTVEAQLNPPISNFGVAGLRKTAKEVLKWPNKYDDHALRMNLFNFYIFIEIGGTGGGCFRYMYARFLREAAAILGNVILNEVADQIHHSGELLSEIAYLFEDAQHMGDISASIAHASELFTRVAGLEEDVFNSLMQSI